MNHIGIIESKDPEFDLMTSSTIVSIFMKVYKKRGNVEDAITSIEINPFLKVKGLLIAINQLKDAKNIPQDLIDELNEKYMHKMI